MSDTIVIIPARGGSKGLPGKNTKLLAGKPLIHYTINTARRVFQDNSIIVSTDSEEIRKCSEETGLKVHFLRPAELATDEAGMREVILHAMDFALQRGDLIEKIVLLQPTSPFRSADQIEKAMQLFRDDLDMVVSVKHTKDNPYFTLMEDDGNGYLKKSKQGNYFRRQDCPNVYSINGSIYVINANSIRQKNIGDFSAIVPLITDEVKSVDIDSLLDWQWAEFLLQKELAVLE